tara:strand:- start:240 stop:869 length:630 start_codon:yes stop_codon:yes gene_type:complete
MKMGLNDKLSTGKALPLMESFHSLQGEGYHSGLPAYFIRLGGCNIGCHWCDVKESWDFQKYPLISVKNIVEKVVINFENVVITGGEPLMWNMNLLTNTLKAKNKKTHLETSGAYEISGIWDWFCLSPKKNRLPTEQAFSRADELKIIIYNKHDLEFAEHCAKNVKNDCLLYLQPEWGKRKVSMSLVVDYIMQNPKWKISLQTHKYLNIP